MKNKILIILGIISLIGLVEAVTIDGTTNIGMPCYNATAPGEMIGDATVKLTCWNSSWNVALGNVSMSVAMTGMFNWTFSNDSGYYSCWMNCTEGAVKTSFGIYKREVPLVATDNIGINLDDTSGTLDRSELGYVFADNSTLTDVLTDTGAVDTASELLTLLTGGNYKVSTQTNFTDVKTKIDEANASLRAYGDANWATCTGFSTHAAADVWSYDTWINRRVNATNAITASVLVAEINESTYQKFTAGSNEDQFKADVSGLATSTDIDNINVSLQTFIANYIDGLNITMLGNFTQTIDSLTAIAGYVDTEITSLLAGQVTISTDLNDTDQYKSNATVEKQNEILAGIITNHTATLTKIDEANASIQAYVTANTSVILGRGNSAWVTASGFETEAIAALRAANLTDNISAVIIYGKNYWNSSNSSIAGLATQVNLTNGIIVLTAATEAQIDSMILGQGTISEDVNSTKSSILTISGDINKTTAVVLNISNVTGEVGKYTQPITDMIGFNGSDGNVLKNISATASVDTTAIAIAVDTQLNDSHGSTNWTGKEATVNNSAIADAVMGYNITPSLTMNGSQYAMYEALILSGYGSYSEQSCPDVSPDYFIGINIGVPWRYP